MSSGRVDLTISERKCRLMNLRETSGIETSSPGVAEVVRSEGVGHEFQTAGAICQGLFVVVKYGFSSIAATADATACSGTDPHLVLDVMSKLVTVNVVHPVLFQSQPLQEMEDPVPHHDAVPLVPVHDSSVVHVGILKIVVRALNGHGIGGENGIVKRPGQGHDDGLDLVPEFFGRGDVEMVYALEGGEELGVVGDVDSVHAQEDDVGGGGFGGGLRTVGGIAVVVVVVVVVGVGEGECRIFRVDDHFFVSSVRRSASAVGIVVVVCCSSAVNVTTTVIIVRIIVVVTQLTDAPKLHHLLMIDLHFQRPVAIGSEIFFRPVGRRHVMLVEIGQSGDVVGLQVFPGVAPDGFEEGEEPSLERREAFVALFVVDIILIVVVIVIVAVAIDAIEMRLLRQVRIVFGSLVVRRRRRLELSQRRSIGGSIDWLLLFFQIPPTPTPTLPPSRHDMGGGGQFSMPMSISRQFH
mmetsp:Transcript_3155/g.5746  ORF Transcript_3155/g.5746 Transcript_3155/m.5746 type:complete len:466 (-) Transcript_3155:454-1851(-)